ncbi:MAG: hypothetical protein ABFD59_06260 [Smithella sp.]
MLNPFVNKIGHIADAQADGKHFLGIVVHSAFQNYFQYTIYYRKLMHLPCIALL